MCEVSLLSSPGSSPPPPPPTSSSSSCSVVFFSTFVLWSALPSLFLTPTPVPPLLSTPHHYHHLLLLLHPTLPYPIHHPPPPPPPPPPLLLLASEKTTEWESMAQRPAWQDNKPQRRGEFFFLSFLLSFLPLGCVFLNCGITLMARRWGGESLGAGSVETVF